MSPEFWQGFVHGFVTFSLVFAAPVFAFEVVRELHRRVVRLA